MTNWNRVVYNRLEQPVSSDWNLTQSQLDETLRNHLDYLFRQRTSISNDRGVARSGFFGDAFKLRPQSPASNKIVVTAGLGFQVVAVNPGTDSNLNGIAGLSDLAQYKPLVLSTDELLTIAPNVDNTKERYDLIEVKADRHFDNTQPVNIYDSAGKVYLPAAPPLAKNFGWDLTTRQGTVTTPTASTAAISVKKGLEAAVGFAEIPAKTTGYIVLGVVYVGTTATTFDADVLMDRRTILEASGQNVISLSWRMVKATGIPVLDSLKAPPGVQVVVVGPNAQDDNAQSSVYIFAGGGYSTMDVFVKIKESANSDAAFNVAQINTESVNLSSVSGLLTGGLTSGNRNTIKTNAGANPNLSLAVGQPHAVFQVTATRQAAGVTSDAGLPATVNYSALISLGGASQY